MSLKELKSILIAITLDIAEKYGEPEKLFKKILDITELTKNTLLFWRTPEIMYAISTHHKDGSIIYISFTARVKSSPSTPGRRIFTIGAADRYIITVTIIVTTVVFPIKRDT